MAIKSLFQGPKVPPTRQPVAAPTRSDAEIEEERRKAVAAAAGQTGRSSTLLTSSSGTSGEGLVRRSLLVA